MLQFGTVVHKRNLFFVIPSGAEFAKIIFFRAIIFRALRILKKLEADSLGNSLVVARSSQENALIPPPVPKLGIMATVVSGFDFVNAPPRRCMVPSEAPVPPNLKVPPKSVRGSTIPIDAIAKNIAVKTVFLLGLNGYGVMWI